MLETVRMDRGIKVNAHTGIAATTTSMEIDSKGHNAIILYFIITAGSGTWTIKIQGKSPLGTFVDMYDLNGNLMAISSVTANKAMQFVGIPNNFKIVATEDVNGATVNVGYELMSV